MNNNQDTNQRSNGHASGVAQEFEEVEPFVKRVVTVKPEDVVIFRLPEYATPEAAAEFKEQLEQDMGSIPFVVIGHDVDLTVLKRSENKGSTLGMLIA